MAAVPDHLGSLGDQVACAGCILGEHRGVRPWIANRGAQTGHGIGLVRHIRVPVENPHATRRFQGANNMIAVGRNTGDLFLIVPADPVI